MAEYRIDYTITRREEDDDDFTEIGFGSSGAWDSPNMCAHMMSSDIEHGQWETSTGMPEPEEVLAALGADDA
jgi:hypothetical protein